MERKFNPSGIMQHYHDKFVPYVWQRWLFTIALLTIHVVRVFIRGRFGFVNFFLGYQIITMFIATISPIDDLLEYKEGEVEVDLDAMNGSKIESSDEAKPFIALCSEPGFWGYMNVSICISFGLTFFEFCDIPVSWFWTVVAWIIVFILMGWQPILRMLKHKDVPVSLVTQGCAGKKVCEL